MSEASTPNVGAPELQGSAGADAQPMSLKQRFDALPSRERAMLLLGTAVLGLFAIWAVAVQPALRTLRNAPAQLDALDAQHQLMQALAGEVGELREVAPVTPEQADLALKAATDRLGAQGRLNIQGDRITLIANGVSAQGLRDWLTEVRAGVRAQPVEVQLNRAANGFTGTVVLVVGAGR